MAKTMGRNSESVITKEFFPSVESRLTPNVKTIMTGHSILLALIKNYRKSRMPTQTRHTNSRPSDIPVQKPKERKRNSEK